MGTVAYRAPADATAGIFTKREESRIFAVIQDLLSVQTEGAFRAWSQGPLQTIMPHGMMIAGIADIGATSTQIQKVLVQNWPLAYFAPLRKTDGGFHSPIMARWQQHEIAQVYDPTVSDDVAPGLWRDVFHAFELGNIAAHGVRDLSGTYATYFNFSQIPQKLSVCHSRLLDLLTPHMHVVLARALREAEPFAGAPVTLSLTARERTVLHWICEGKTTWEIAQICSRSPHTIKHQIETLYRKLDVSSRAQAIKRATGLRMAINPAAGNGSDSP